MFKEYKKIWIYLIFVLSINVLSQGVFADNLQKDTDIDGITDKAEVEIYKTDPNNEDTDNDTILDYQEILDKTNPLDAKSNKIESTKILLNKSPLLWYIGRASGIASFIMFSFVICFGLMMTSKILLKVKIFTAPQVLESHQFTATFIAFLLLIVHITSFILDDYFKLTIQEALIPFLIIRDLNSAMDVNISIPVSIGIISFYLAIVLILTSQFRKKIVSVKIWRKIHYSSFVFYILFLLHGIFSGTDSKEPWMIGIYSASALVVVSLILLRIFGKKYFLPKISTNTNIKNDKNI